MKNLLSTFFILVFTISIQAQHFNESSSGEFYKKQVGISFTDFALRYFSLSFNEVQGATPPILVFYKKGDNRKKWRYGVGGSLNFTRRPFNSLSQNSIRLDFNFGREYYRKISKKWKTYIGWEIQSRFAYNQTIYRSANINVESQKNTSLYSILGAGVLIGLQYNFNERFSLLTESSYVLRSSYQTNQDQQESYGITSIYRPPVALILNYHF